MIIFRLLLADLLIAQFSDVVTKTFKAKLSAFKSKHRYEGEKILQAVSFPKNLVPIFSKNLGTNCEQI